MNDIESIFVEISNNIEKEFKIYWSKSKKTPLIIDETINEKSSYGDDLNYLCTDGRFVFFSF